jgi:hypothetical protein
MGQFARTLGACLLLVVSQFSSATDSRGVSLVKGEQATEPFASVDPTDEARSREGKGMTLPRP